MVHRSITIACVSARRALLTLLLLAFGVFWTNHGRGDDPVALAPPVAVATEEQSKTGPLAPLRADSETAEPPVGDAAPVPDTSRVQPVRVERDQRYSEQSGRAGLCDVYFPAAAPPPTGYPVIVGVHGGGWVSGDKWTIATYSRLFAKEGFVAVTINYRLAPAHRFPAQADDVRSAMVWVKQNAKQLKFNLKKLGLFGYSAGGHLSALLASLADESMVVRSAASDWSIEDPKWKQLPEICAICAGGPPCDFRSLPIDNSALAYFLGGSRREQPAAYVAASPAAHVSENDPVTQLFHGEGDAMVPLAGTRQFHRSQVKVGIDSRLKVIPKQGHMLTFISPQTYRTVVGFFREVFQVEQVVIPQ